MASGPSERARLLGLARDYILEHGVVDLSLSRLARGIGSNNRMLLYHFTSLDQIVGAAIDEILDRGVFVAKLTELMLAERSSGERIAAAWRHISNPERLPHLRLFFARFGMAADRPDRFGPFLERTRTEWTEAVAGALADDDRIPDPRQTATAIVSVWRGLQILLIAGEPRSAVDSSHTLAMKAILHPYPGT
ncbi:TetR/AcrR family transcriptional regulator [Pseudonocardia spinosispora]|uniref:TetR/AcrR family transcriptional regulator n=1 Tax=Pseudonocardia spinosispora TaxID=103441 RepID=UPI00041542F9|nr:TetR/AcrR family transcriptional regulator [Pseudonocardia spinosispora]